MPQATQIIRALARTPAMISTRQTLDVQRIIHNAIAIQQIPAPTFEEAQRAHFIQKRFTQYALEDIALDHVHNVYGRWPGADPSRPALLVAAHTDTVFPADTDLTIRHEQDQIYGPGLGDNSLGVAGLLALLDILQAHQLRPIADIWFVANSREEGLGNLDGIRAVWQTLGSRLGAAIVIEGMGLGRIYHAGIAVRRLRIICDAPGGHSWVHFGKPSAIHGIIELGACITALTPPSKPRTTYNIGLISGGHSINSLATQADIYLDLRSQETTSLAELEHQVMHAIEALQQPNLTFTCETVGDRPAGHMAIEHPLVQLATAALAIIGHQPIYETGSTDANLLLAQGLPAITIGITFGSHAHRLDEHIETGPISNGIWQLILLTLAAADHLQA